MGTRFTPGLELNRAFYEVVVGPIVSRWEHDAALLGWGSDVLGYDTERSTDHGWGPRLQVFVPGAEVTAVRAALEAELPAEFDGWPVRYGWDETPVSHHVEVATLPEWFRCHLGRDPGPVMSNLDWLLVPQQQLLGAVRGAVFHDGTGELAATRAALQWYPDDVWRWLLACQWHRIAQAEAFPGRTAEVGDDLGSRLAAARLVHEVMRLAFLLAREYWPYDKWFGTAFAELPVAERLERSLARVLHATDPADREWALTRVLEGIATEHNAASITEPIDPTTRPYHSRGFPVLMADRFTDACVARVADPWLRALPLVGSIDQFADSTDVLQFPDRAGRLAALYGDAQTRSRPSATNP
ncbi:MAG: DUF4037 domain-containing protein [Acidimicrobiia bacterium]